MEQEQILNESVISIYELPKIEEKKKEKLLWAIQYLENDIEFLQEDLIKLKKLLRKNNIKVFNTKRK